MKRYALDYGMVAPGRPGRRYRSAGACGGLRDRCRRRNPVLFGTVQLAASPLAVDDTVVDLLEALEREEGLT